MGTVKSGLPVPGSPPLTVQVTLLMEPVNVIVPVEAKAAGAASPAMSRADVIALRFIRLTLLRSREATTQGGSSAVGRHGAFPRAHAAECSSTRATRILSDLAYKPYGRLLK